MGLDLIPQVIIIIVPWILKRVDIILSTKHTPTFKRVTGKVINPTIATMAIWEERRQKKLKRGR